MKIDELKRDRMYLVYCPQICNRPFEVTVLNTAKKAAKLELTIMGDKTKAYWYMQKDIDNWDLIEVLAY